MQPVAPAAAVYLTDDRAEIFLVQVAVPEVGEGRVEEGHQFHRRGKIISRRHDASPTKLQMCLETSTFLEGGGEGKLLSVKGKGNPILERTSVGTGADLRLCRYANVKYFQFLKLMLRENANES